MGITDTVATNHNGTYLIYAFSIVDIVTSMFSIPKNADFSSRLANIAENPWESAALSEIFTSLGFSTRTTACGAFSLIILITSILLKASPVLCKIVTWYPPPVGKNGQCIRWGTVASQPCKSIWNRSSVQGIKIKLFLYRFIWGWMPRSKCDCQRHQGVTL